MSTVQPVQIRVDEHSCTQIRRSHLSKYVYVAQCKKYLKTCKIELSVRDFQQPLLEDCKAIRLRNELHFTS